MKKKKKKKKKSGSWISWGYGGTNGCFIDSTYGFFIDTTHGFLLINVISGKGQECGFLSIISIAFNDENSEKKECRAFIGNNMDHMDKNVQFCFILQAMLRLLFQS